MYVCDYMTKNPYTISEDVTIDRAREILKEKNFRHLPVVDENNYLLGIITDRDIRSAYPSSLASDEERKKALEMVSKTPVKEIMSKNLSTLNPDATLDDALLFFKRHIVGAIPITDKDNKLVGIFSIRDMIKAYSEIFGLGEKGSQLIAIERETDTQNQISRIVKVLENHKIPFNRIMSTEKRIYIRIQTYNLQSVKASLEQEGVKLLDKKVEV